MSAEAFFVDPADVSGDRADLRGTELRHARLVLRLGAGDAVVLLDGAGGRYRARFLSASRSDGKMEILSRETEPEPAFSLTLALALLKGERCEWALQKGTELGVASFIPLVTERTEVRPGSAGRRPGPAEGREDRWRRILRSACKQCGRARFPTLSPALSLPRLDPAGYGSAFVLREGGEAPPLSIPAGKGGRRTCLLVVGPEGGLAREEVEELRRKGAVPASLGPRTLRAETAAVAGVVILQYLAGGFFPKPVPV